MKLLKASDLLGTLRAKRKRRKEAFLGDVSGVIHVGANSGQERYLYDEFGLDVVWIEPIPEVFEQLQENIADFPKQRAVRGLVTDSDGGSYEFHIANNNGESSSILDLKEHADIWPDVQYSSTIRLTGTTLPSLLDRETIDLSPYQALIMDTQGSELLVLKGAIPILEAFRYIKTEVADFEAYAGCCQLMDVDAFMTKHGFEEYSVRVMASRPGGGGYYNVVYRRRC